MNLPNWLIASKFSWDMNVDLYNKMLNIDYMPIGIHAWPKNIRYWQDKLEELNGNNLVIDFCENKYKEFFSKYYQENNVTVKDS